MADTLTATIPAVFMQMLKCADVSWQPTLRSGLQALAAAYPDYLIELVEDNYVPTDGRLFAAFTQPMSKVRYVLVGEGPYPRPESANGFCFMDGAVDALWSEGGLSKPVNRATSLRNFMKMLLVAEGSLKAEHTSGTALAPIAAEANAAGSAWVQTLTELQQNLTSQGFLLLNATLVFRPHVAPLKEAKAWQVFLQCVLAALATHAQEINTTPPTLILWGKIAEQLKAVPAMAQLPQVASEHPYNLSFILNPVMQALFAPMHLLRR